MSQAKIDLFIFFLNKHLEKKVRLKKFKNLTFKLKYQNSKFRKTNNPPPPPKRNKKEKKNRYADMLDSYTIINVL